MFEGVKSRIEAYKRDKELQEAYEMHAQIGELASNLTGLEKPNTEAMKMLEEEQRQVYENYIMSAPYRHDLLGEESII